MKPPFWHGSTYTTYVHSGTPPCCDHIINSYRIHLIHLPISFRVTSPALRQPRGCPAPVRKLWKIWLNHLTPNHNRAKQSANCVYNIWDILCRCWRHLLHLAIPKRWRILRAVSNRINTINKHQDKTQSWIPNQSSTESIKPLLFAFIQVPGPPITKLWDVLSKDSWSLGPARLGVDMVVRITLKFVERLNW